MVIGMKVTNANQHEIQDIILEHFVRFHKLIEMKYFCHQIFSSSKHYAISDSSPMDIANFQGHANIMNMMLEHFANQMMLSDNKETINSEFGYYQ